MATNLAIAAAALSFGCLLLSSTVSYAAQPNILLILVDDMGNSDASFNWKLTNKARADNGESAPILTPNMDYLAENGIIFKNHYTNMICGPSRSALLSSRFAYKIGNPFAIRNAGHLLPKYKTFAHELQVRGYRNHFIGKYGIDQGGRTYDEEQHLYEPEPTHNDELGPLSRGFHTFYGLYNSGHDHFKKTVIGIFIDWHKFNETHFLEAPRSLDTEPELSSTHIFTRETINAIKQDTANKRPWFVHLSYTMPHDPMMVDDRYVEEFEHCRKMKGWRRRIYCGMVTSVDEGIGNVTRYLRESGVMENTVIIFSSDNGGFANVGGFNYPFRGMKISPYEGGVKTISFIHSPKVFPKTSGRVFEGNIHLVDWGPSLLGIVDRAMGETHSKHAIMGDDIDGMDFTETLQHFANAEYGAVADEAALLSRDEFVVEARWWNNLTVYRYGDYKLFLGTQVYDQLFIEPDDEYALNSADRAKYENYDWVLTDWINYFIFNVLGTDYFWFEWNISIMMRVLYNRLVLREPQCPQWGIPSVETRPPNKQTFHYPYVDNWRPECNRVRLYNLKTDPTESDNLAYKQEHRELLIEILGRLRKKLDREYELGQIEYDVSSDGLMPLVLQTQTTLRRTMIAVVVGVVLWSMMSVCICYRCFCKSNAKSKVD